MLRRFSFIGVNDHAHDRIGEFEKKRMPHVKQRVRSLRKVPVLRRVPMMRGSGRMVDGRNAMVVVEALGPVLLWLLEMR